jgi:hypothetical protein
MTEGKIVGQIVGEKFNHDRTVAVMFWGTLGVVDNVGSVSVLDHMDVEGRDVVSMEEQGEVVVSIEVSTKETKEGSSSVSTISLNDRNVVTLIEVIKMPVERSRWVIVIEGDSSEMQIDVGVPKMGYVDSFPDGVVASCVFAPIGIRTDQMPNIKRISWGKAKDWLTKAWDKTTIVVVTVGFMVATEGFSND